MAQDTQETDDFVNGVRTSFYLQKELETGLNKAVEEYSGFYKSRSHFINCAIVRELRRLKTLEPEIKRDGEQKQRNVLQTD